MKFIKLLSFLKSIAFIHLLQSLFSTLVICLHLSVFTIPIFSLTFTTHILMFSVNIPNFFLTSLPSISAAIQQCLHPLPVTCEEIHCHGLDPLAQQFCPGLLYCPGGVRTWPLQGTIQNTVSLLIS